MTRICHDCPFRSRTFLPLHRDDAAALIEFVEDGDVAICHETARRPCGGAIAFRAGDTRVFANRLRMLRAHVRSQRVVKGTLWGIEP